MTKYILNCIKSSAIVFLIVCERNTVKCKCDSRGDCIQLLRDIDFPFIDPKSSTTWLYFLNLYVDFRNYRTKKTWTDAELKKLLTPVYYDITPQEEQCLDQTDRQKVPRTDFRCNEYMNPFANPNIMWNGNLIITASSTDHEVEDQDMIGKTTPLNLT